MIGTKDSIHDATVVTGTLAINGLYASILFDSFAKRSFNTPKFRKHSSLKSMKLDEPYVVEMANGESGST